MEQERMTERNTKGPETLAVIGWTATVSFCVSCGGNETNNWQDKAAARQGQL